MNDPATLTAQPRRLRLAGDEYDVHPLTLSDFGRLQAWIDAQRPDPFETVNRQIATGRYNVEQQKFLLRAALEESAKTCPIGTAEADVLLQSMAGVLELLFIAVSKGDPAFTREKAAELQARLTFADVAHVFQVTNADQVLTADPKAGAGAGAAGTATPTPTTTTPPTAYPAPTGGSSSTTSPPTSTAARSRRSAG